MRHALASGVLTGRGVTRERRVVHARIRARVVAELVAEVVCLALSLRGAVGGSVRVGLHRGREE